MNLPPNTYQIENARRQDTIRRAEQEQLARIAAADQPNHSNPAAPVLRAVKNIMSRGATVQQTAVSPELGEAITV